MKKLLLQFCLILVFIFSNSCSKDDNIDKSSLEGTWKLTAFTLKIPLDLNNDGIETSSFMPGCLNGSALNFTDMTRGSLFFNSIVSYNTTVEDGNLFFMTSCSTDSDRAALPITYTLDDEIITISSESQLYLLTIDGNELFMEIPGGFNAYDIDTFETTVSQDITYIFTKQ